VKQSHVGGHGEGFRLFTHEVRSNRTSESPWSDRNQRSEACFLRFPSVWGDGWDLCRQMFTAFGVAACLQVECDQLAYGEIRHVVGQHRARVEMKSQAVFPSMKPPVATSAQVFDPSVMANSPYVEDRGAFCFSVNLLTF